MIKPINAQFRGESIISVLIAVLIFAMLFLSYTQWQQSQQQQRHLIFQKQQALQIAENQIALQMAGLPCDTEVRQNGLSFSVQCSTDQISVIYPLGKLMIKKNND